MPYDENTNTHAMCEHYGHAWSKHDGLTARQSKGYRVEVCDRSGCDAARRVYVG
ncbi:hypothetical protein HAPG_00034 [Halorubrum phage GNf2]|nr:hypothetical protein HAPG_00034 [Halorubrum phage GNf2]